MKSSDAFAKYGFTHFVVANIDFLGQRCRLEKLSQFGIDELNDNKQAITLQKDTFLAVANIRDALNDLMYDEGREADLKCFSEAERAAVEEILRSRTINQSFSDSLVYHIDISDEPAACAVNVWTVLQALAYVFPIALSAHTPLRGGIALGWAGHIGENEIYGPAPLCAHLLEQNAAQYPRIVLDSRTPAFMRELASLNADDVQSRIARLFAAWSLELVTTDDDDRPILHYLSERQLREEDTEFQSYVLPKARDFARSELEAYTKTNNLKLAPRYARLNAYFDKYMRAVL